MDRSAVKKVVDDNIEGLLEKLGIAHWKVRISYDLRSGTEIARHSGYCTRLVDYNKAHVEIDCDECDDEAEVLKILRHELFHIVLAPIDILTNALDAAVTKDEALRGAMESIRTHAIEKAVINLERMWHGLTDKPASPLPGSATESAVDQSEEPKP
jgi:hypothetical protein